MDKDNGYIILNGRRFKKIGERTGEKMADIYKPKIEGKNFQDLDKSTKKRIANRFKAELSNKATNSEKKFRDYLFKLQIPHSFQHEILSDGQFIIADFFFRRLNLVIEIDGGYHTSKKQKSRDYYKDLHYEELNLNVIRIINEDVKNFPFSELKTSSDKYMLSKSLYDMSCVKKTYEPLKAKKKRKPKNINNKRKNKCCGKELIRRETKGNNRRKNQEYGYKYVLVCSKCGKVYLDKTSIFYF